MRRITAAETTAALNAQTIYAAMLRSQPRGFIPGDIKPEGVSWSDWFMGRSLIER